MNYNQNSAISKCPFSASRMVFKKSKIENFTKSSTQNFVQENSIVRELWGKSDTILFIFAGAAAEFARWKLAGGRVLKGLVRRREAEAALYRAGSAAQAP